MSKVVPDLIYLHFSPTALSSFSGWDTRIPLPLEKPLQGDLSISAITAEMVLAGLIRSITDQPTHEHRDYYKTLALRLKPTLLEDLWEGALRKAQQKEFAFAETLFLSLKAFHRSPALLLNLALLYEDAEKHFAAAHNDHKALEFQNKALKTYQEALSLEPPSEELFFNAGYFFLKIHSFQSAHSAFNEFIKISHNNIKKEKVKNVLHFLDNQRTLDVLFKEAYDFITLDQNDKALERIEHFLSLHPEVWNAWFIKGWALRKKKEFTLALESFQKSLELADLAGAPQDDLYNEMGLCYFGLKDFHQAEIYFEKTLFLRPQKITALSNLALLFWEQGEKNKALSFFNRIIKIDPEDPIARHYLPLLLNS